MRKILSVLGLLAIASPIAANAAEAVRPAALNYTVGATAPLVGSRMGAPVGATSAIDGNGASTFILIAAAFAFGYFFDDVVRHHHHHHGMST